MSTEPLSKLPRHQATECRSRCVFVYVCLRSCGVDALLLTRGQFREAFCDVGSFVDTKAVSSSLSSSPGSQAGAKGRHIPKSHLGITALDTLAHRRNLAAPAFLALPLDHVRATLPPTQLLPVLTTMCTHCCCCCCSLIASPMQPNSWLETARMPMQGAGLMSGWTAVMQCPSNACTVSPPTTTMPLLLTHLLWGSPLHPFCCMHHTRYGRGSLRDQAIVMYWSFFGAPASVAADPSRGVARLVQHCLPPLCSSTACTVLTLWRIQRGRVACLFRSLARSLVAANVIRPDHAPPLPVIRHVSEQVRSVLPPMPLQLITNSHTRQSAPIPPFLPLFLLALSDV